MQIENYLDLSKTIASEIFSGLTYPWEALPKIKDFILNLGPKLPKDEFEEIFFKRWEKKIYEVYFIKHNRIFYVTVDKENIYLLHACRKQKNQTEKRIKIL